MASSTNTPRNPKITIAVDIGSVKTCAAFQITDHHGTRLPRHAVGFQNPMFPSAYGHPEIPATILRTSTGYVFGFEANIIHLYRPTEAIMFPNIKHCLTGTTCAPTTRLQDCFDKVNQRWGVREDIIHIFADLFKFIIWAIEMDITNFPAHKEMFQAWPFKDVEKEFIITYPLERNIALRLSMMQGALDAGCCRVRMLTDLFAASRRVAKFEKTKNPWTCVVLDCGDLTTSATVIHVTRGEDGEVDRVRQIGSPESLLAGNKSINDYAMVEIRKNPAIQDKLDTLNWEHIAYMFSRAKRHQKKLFDDGTHLLNMGNPACPNVTLTERDMIIFTLPIVDATVKLALKQYSAAVKEGFTPSDLVLCGGPTFNDQFRNMVFTIFKSRVKIQHDHDIEFVALYDNAYIPHGALLHAEDLLRDAAAATTEPATTEPATTEPDTTEPDTTEPDTGNAAQTEP
ncbi:hypothetical protein BJX70DRAFT_74696 [Aspergillus crustosus]